MLSFVQFLTEQADVAAIRTVVSHGTHRTIDAPMFGIQFVLPDGDAVELDKDLVHARAVYEKGKASGLDIRLIDVLKAGVVRAASASMYQVGAPITSAQAQFMFDRSMAHKDNELFVSIADDAMAARNADSNHGIGPIEIDDRTSKSFDLERAKPVSVRSWVAAQFH